MINFQALKKSTYTLLTISLLFSLSCGISKKMGGKTTSEKANIEFKYLISEAAKQTMLGNKEEAIGIYLKCLEIKPKSAAPNFFTAQLYLEQDDLQSALVFAEKAVQLNTENSWYKVLNASVLQKLNRLQDAANLYSETIQQAPEKEFLYFELIRLNFSLSQPKEAIKNYTRYEKHFGLSEQTSLALYDLYASEKQFDKAQAKLKKLELHFPDSAKYPALAAELFVEEGKMEQAKKQYNKLLKRFPNDDNLKLSYASYCRVVGNRDEFKKNIDIVFHSSQIDTQTKTKLLLAGAGIDFSAEEFEEYITLLIEESPGNAKVFLVYANFLMSIKQKRQATENYRYAIQIDNSDIKLCLLLLKLDTELQDYKTLLTDAEPLLEIYPNQPIIYLYHGTAAFFTKDYNTAITSLEYGKSILIDDKQMEYKFYSYLGDTYHALKKYKKSDTNFEFLLAANPNDYGTANKYAYFLSERDTKLEKAEQLILLCLNNNAQSAAYNDTYARVLYQQKKYKAAKKYSDIAVRNSTKNSGILEKNGDILYRLGNKKGAIKMWKLAAKNGGNNKNLNIKIKGNFSEIETIIF